MADDVHFRYPADFDLHEWLSKGWQLQAGGEPTEVIIRFDKDIADWIAGGQWHPAQRLEREDGGTLLFKVTVSGYEEMLYWVLSFGAQAEALEPAPLRAAVAEAARQMTARYDLTD